MILWNFFGDKILPKQEKNNKIDSINYVLKNIELNQKKIDSILYDYNKKISSIDESIIKIKIDKGGIIDMCTYRQVTLQLYFVLNITVAQCLVCTTVRQVDVWEIKAHCSFFHLYNSRVTTCQHLKTGRVNINI